MGLPKKNKKNVNINPNKIGNDRREELFEDISNNGTYLPKGVLHEDMDKSFVEFIENGINLNLAGEKVPVIFLTIQRWAEFAKTWPYYIEKWYFGTPTIKEEKHRKRNCPIQSLNYRKCLL